MAVKVGINGFGGSAGSFLAWWTRSLLGSEIDVVAVVDITTEAKYFAYQLKYDSIQGASRAPWGPRSRPGEAEDDVLIVDGKIKCIGQGAGRAP